MQRAVDLLGAQGALGAQAQQLDVADILALEGFGPGDKDIVAGLALGAGQQVGVPGLQVLAGIGVAPADRLALHQLAKLAAIVVDGKEAGARVLLALRHRQVGQREGQALRVDPDDLADIGAIGAVGHGGRHVGQVQHRQHDAAMRRRGAHRQAAAVRREAGRQHLRWAEESRRIGSAGCGLGIGPGGRGQPQGHQCGSAVHVHTLAPWVDCFVRSISSPSPVPRSAWRCRPNARGPLRRSVPPGCGCSPGIPGCRHR